MKLISYGERAGRTKHESLSDFRHDTDTTYTIHGKENNETRNKQKLITSQIILYEIP